MSSMENRLHLHDEHPDWPEPDKSALANSRNLVDLIKNEVRRKGGRIGFDRFMEMALYEPGLGYYSAGSRKFGHDGDFITAPEISPLFSWCLARQCKQVFEITGTDRILELGAGSGTMASDILDELERCNALPGQYLIMEPSADLKDRQSQTLEKKHPGLVDRIKWLDKLPDEPFDGVILANEVVDAMPVKKIIKQDKAIRELCVTHNETGFVWEINANVDDDLDCEVTERLSAQLDLLEDGYLTEINLLIKPFTASLSDIISTGVVLLIDYGYTRKEYYHPQRTTGTMVCHYRHRSHDNPFIFVGCQDISTFVDFTAVAESASVSGLDVHGYQSQAGFLISCGIDEVMEAHRSDDARWNLQLSQQAGQLMLPGGMGEKFKVMALTRNISAPLKGFQSGNSVYRL